MQFYVLSNERWDGHETLFCPMKPVHRGDARRCPACGGCISGLSWLPPHRAEIEVHGRGLGDVAYFSDDLLVSDRFRVAWQAAGLRGIESFDPLERVRIRPARFGKKPVTYFHVAPQFFETHIDLARSRIEYDHPSSCEKCRGASIDGIRGFAIDESSWTGEDLFLASDMPGSTIVSDRVRKLRDDYGLTNVNLIPVEQYCWAPLKGRYIKGQEPDE